jgi:flagellar assembly protein FliH
LSRVFKGQEGPQYKIGAFKMDEMQDANLQGQYSGESGDKGKYDQVSSWDLPQVEQEEMHAEQREDFNAKLARLEKEAYEKGFEQGQRDGLALEKRKMEEVRRQIEDMFVSIRDLKPRIYTESEGEILKLVMLMVKKVIGEEVRQNSAVIGNTIKSAMRFLTDKRRIRIILNPDDMEEVKKLLPDISAIAKGGQFQLSEDRAINRGGCILETGFGKINACIEDQLKNLEEEIERLYHASSGKKR